MECLYGDKHFGRRFKDGVEEADGLAVITTHKQVGVTKDGMKLHKRRWVVERTFAWELCSGRLTRDFEHANKNMQKLSSTSAQPAVSSITLLI